MLDLLDPLERHDRFNSVARVMAEGWHSGENQLSTLFEITSHPRGWLVSFSNGAAQPVDMARLMDTVKIGFGHCNGEVARLFVFTTFREWYQIEVHEHPCWPEHLAALEDTQPELLGD